MRSVFGIVLHLGECMICREGGGCADDAAGCDLAGRYALGGLGQRCGERIAQSYAAGLQSRFAGPNTSGQPQNI